MYAQPVEVGKKRSLTEQAQNLSPELPCDVTCYEIAEDKKEDAITTGFILLIYSYAIW